MKSNLVKSNLLLVFIGLGLLAACSDSNSYSSKNVTKAEVEPVEQIDDVKGTLNDREASPSLIQSKSPQSTTQSTIQEFPKSARLTAQQSNSRINLRSKPSSTSPDKGYGLVGDPVKLLDKAEDANGLTWYYVKFDVSGAEGWIRSDFIQTPNGVSEKPLERIRAEVAKAAKLTPEQVNQLMDLDHFSQYEFKEDKPRWNGKSYGIIVPTYVPEGFYVSKFDVSKFDGRDGPGGYSIAYENNDGTCFGISTATGGLGDGAEEVRVIEVESLALGKIKIGRTEFSQYSEKPLTNFWVSVGKVSYLFDSPSQGRYKECNSVSLREAAKIVESLDYLNPVPEGYPPTKQWQPL